MYYKAIAGSDFQEFCKIFAICCKMRPKPARLNRRKSISELRHGLNWVPNNVRSVSEFRDQDSPSHTETTDT
jgi:hypothetical protein